MRRYTIPLVTTVALAAGVFAGASIASGGSLVAALTGTTGTGAAVTAGATQTTGEAGNRRVTICHRTHSKKHPAKTITVDQHALRAQLRRGDSIGACTSAEQPLPNGKPGSSKSDAAGEHATPPQADDEGKAKPVDKSSAKPEDKGAAKPEDKGNGNGKPDDASGKSGDAGSGGNGGNGGNGKGKH